MRRNLIAAVAALALAGLAAGGAQAAPSGEIRRVTLVTGDVVEVAAGGGKPAVTAIRPGPGRERVGFETRWVDGHVHVIPGDAGRLLGAGRLDPRLFDVSQLLAWGYDDAGRGDVPVLAERARGAARTAVRATLTHSLDTLGIDALKVDKPAAGAFWRGLTARSFGGAVTKLWLDGKRELTLDRSVPQIGAPTAWQHGLTGKGVTVAVLDSGYDQSHPDLRGVVTQARGFTDRGPSDVQDVFGHGTHVSSIVAGSGAASGGKYRGVAPDAGLAVGKLGDDDAPESATLAGMEWAATDVKAKVVNMSLGGPDTRGLDLLERAVDELTAKTGTLFVIAAGNDGEAGERTMLSPGSADAALTVGAVDEGDELADLSSRGPRLGDLAVKPDVTAPGIRITAAVPQDVYGQPYAEKLGTSMAAPHVTGAAAILAQAHPEWNAELLKGALIGSAKPRAGLSPYAQGAGRVDVARAVTQDVSASPGNLSTYLRWPSPDPVTRTVTLANDGAAPVTLSLAVAATRYGGGSTPDRLFDLDAREITVPAHGTAPVRLTMDPRGTAPGAYVGTLTATSGSTVVRTIVDAYVEPPAHELTVEAIGRDGKPAFASLLMHDQDSSFAEPVADEAARFPDDGYNVVGRIFTPRSGGFQATVVNVPVALGGEDRRVVIDAREAVSPATTLDEPTAEQVDLADVGFVYRRGGASYATFSSFEPAADTFVLPVRQPGLDYFNHTTWFKRGTIDEDGVGHDSPYRYELVDYRAGGVPRDVAYAARRRDLAKVTTVYRAQDVPGRAERGTRLVLPTGEETFATGVHQSTLPYTMAEYYTPGPQARWLSYLRYGAAGAPFIASVGGRSPHGYTMGRHRETVNAAVLGPAFEPRCFPDYGTCLARDQDAISYGFASLFADSGGRDHTGGDGTQQGTVILAREGKVIEQRPLQEALRADVPPESATYTLAVSATRGGPHTTLSTRVDAEYTFRSEHTDERRSLPLMAVRFAPRGLDDRNRARAGSLTRVPVSVQRNPGADRAGVASIAVEASGDDGATWRAVRVDRGIANVRNPASGHVSLRAHVVDTAGNEVKQTIVHAYAVRPR